MLQHSKKPSNHRTLELVPEPWVKTVRGRDGEVLARAPFRPLEA